MEEAILDALRSFGVVFESSSVVGARRARPEATDENHRRSRYSFVKHAPQPGSMVELCIDHTQLTCRYQGRDFRLSDVAGGDIKGIVA